MNSTTVFRPDLLKGQVILVSGAGSGLGEDMALLFASLGASLVICGRRKEKLDAVAARIERLGAEVLARPMSIRDPKEVAALIDAAWQRFGRLDALINNAGGQFAQSAVDFSVGGWSAVIDTNLNGTWYMTQAAARRWIAEGRPGHVVNIVLDIWRGNPGIAHSSAARAGVVYMSKSVAVEWAPYRVRVNCIAAGLIETSGFAHYADDVQKSFTRSNPMLRTGRPADISQLCCYLLSPAGDFINGEVITVDGGQQLWGDVWPAGRPEWFSPSPVANDAS